MAPMVSCVVSMGVMCCINECCQWYHNLSCDVSCGVIMVDYVVSMVSCGIA